MRFFTLVLAVFAALVVAQQNAINISGSTLDIRVGQNTITWSNPSSGTVTIKLQQGSAITPDSGLVLASNIPASAQTATFTITADEVNTFQYTIEIIDNSNPSNINFSPNFGIQGATGTATATATSSANSALSSAVSSALSSGSSASSSASRSSSSAASSSSHSASSSSSASASRSSASSSSASASATSAPHSGAGSIKVQGGLVALIAGAVAMF